MLHRSSRQPSARCASGDGAAYFRIGQLGSFGPQCYYDTN
jgi:hypothetical protein